MELQDVIKKAEVLARETAEDPERLEKYGGPQLFEQAVLSVAGLSPDAQIRVAAGIFVGMILAGAAAN